MKHTKRLFQAVLLASLVLVMIPVPVHAATTITVSTLADDTTNGNGCSLREAITNANNDALTFSDCFAGSGADTINFAGGLNGTLLLNSSLPTLTDSDGLSINGGTSKIIVDGNNTFGIFNIPAGVTVSLQNLTIANGFGSGSMIYNSGTLNLQSSTLMGGIGTLGGAVYNSINATASITNSTFTLNTADFGSAVFNDNGTVIFNNSTIYDNMLSGGGTGVLYNNGIMTIKNTIVANGNGVALCAGNALNLASTNNLTDDLSCGPSFATWTLAELALGPLANNGGSTMTFALMPASVAINAGNGSSCPITDQRGTGRPQGTICDAGSFEAKISLSVNPTSLAFGNIVVGVESLPKTITITNTGEANIVIGVVTITSPVPGEFNIMNDLCSTMVIAPAGTCTFDVTFTPTSNVARSGTITIPSNTLIGQNIISISGTGINGTNLILNPGFEYPYKQPIGWKNPIAPYTLNAVVDKFTGYGNSCCSLRLPGAGRLFQVYQGVASAGKPGFRFLISLTSKADNISVVGINDIYVGRVIFQDRANRPTETFTFTFTPGTHDWEKLQYSIVTTKDFYNFVFRIYLRSPTGVAWFDNATVIRLP